MSDLQIYNTESGQKETFAPWNPKKVTMYVCGPTVYDLLHVGNFRGPIFFNLVRNWLDKLGYATTYVLNYTDVDDKIINRANELKTSPAELTEKYIGEYKKDFDRLGLRPHDANPRVTKYMSQIIATIQQIIDHGAAYVVDGEVIFSVKKFQSYGKLSHKNLEDLIAGIRVEVSDKKESPADFTLWKPAKPGEPSWASPWGEGRPGWHIECSAMAQALLGQQVDIHGGGIDLIFPHHENEIAQSETANQKKFVKYWMHHNFLNFGANKMSKSLGNVKTARSFLDQYGPEVLKFLFLRSQYRSLLDFSDQQISDAITGLARIYSAMSLAQFILASQVENSAEVKAFDDAVKKADQGIHDALNDDFNTPVVMAQIFEVIRQFNGLYRRGQKISGQAAYAAQRFLDWIREWGSIMALFQEDASSFLRKMDDLLLQQKNIKREDIDAMVQLRISARENKDFKKSDEFRDKLAQMGIQLQDTPQGTFWEVQK